MENDFDFLSTLGADWPEPKPAVELPAIPVLEDDLTLQPSGHAADDLIRALEVDDLLRHVIGMGQAELAQSAVHEELLKNQAATDAQLQRMEEIGQLQAMGLSKSAAEFAVPITPPVPVGPRPGQLPTRPTPVHPVKVPSRHRAPLAKLLAKVFPVAGHSRNVRDAWDALLDSAEDFVNNAVRNCA